MPPLKKINTSPAMPRQVSIIQRQEIPATSGYYWALYEGDLLIVQKVRQGVYQACGFEGEIKKDRIEIVGRVARPAGRLR